MNMIPGLYRRRCPKCIGSGKRSGETCKTCGGSGKQTCYRHERPSRCKRLAKIEKAAREFIAREPGLSYYTTDSTEYAALRAALEINNEGETNEKA